LWDFSAIAAERSGFEVCFFGGTRAAGPNRAKSKTGLYLFFYSISKPLLPGLRQAFPTVS
jgi:hypothetical protein